MATTSSYFAAHQGSHRARSRANDGLHVQLSWRPDEADVTVIVDDPALGVIFAGSVTSERAFDAFSHLFDSLENPAVVSTVAPRRGGRRPTASSKHAN